MFRKLQRRFLWGSALVLFLVIVVVISIIFWITTNTVTRQSEVFIERILENDGRMPDRGEFAPQQKTFLALNDESIREIRFVSVLISEGSNQIISKMIAVLSDDEVIGLAKKAMESGADSGQLGRIGPRIMHYGRKILEDGSALVVIADSTSRYSLTRLIVTYMAVLWFAVLVLFMIAMSRTSRKLVKPFIENDERQKRFITNASHELKTPLAVIAANNELTEAISGKNKWTESTARQIERLQLLIENLVALTRLDEMEEKVMEDVDLTATMIEAADPFRSIIESSGRKYEFQIEQNIHVNGEKRTLQQITSILMDNATKYCDEGGTVTVRLTRKGKGAQLSVSNTYAKGKMVDTSRFFERFYREDESHSSAKPGFGIGLSMAREMSERMNGKLNISYSGDQITFSVETDLR